MRSTYLLPLVLIACGDNGEMGVPPDGPPKPDAAPDSAVVECNYTEMADATNDNFFGSGTEEPTGVSFDGKAVALCGKFESSHYNVGMMAVDVDSYKIAVNGTAPVLMYLTAAGAENFNTVLIEIYRDTPYIDEVGQFRHGAAITSARLTPGTYTINVSSFDDAAATADVAYKLVLVPDSPTRCAKATTPASYTEANDGATASGNDVYEVRYGGSPARKLTALGTDAPEVVTSAVKAGDTIRISGVSSSPVTAPVSWMDSFQDRDTYQITTGAGTTMVSMRLNWAATTADMDLLVFPMNGIVDFADGYYNANMEDEFVTFSAAPNETFWVFVGTDDASTGQPLDYDLTVCGAALTF